MSVGIFNLFKSMVNLKRPIDEKEDSDDGEVEEEVEIKWNQKENKNFATGFRSQQVQILTNAISVLLRNQKVTGRIEIDMIELKKEINEQLANYHGKIEVEDIFKHASNNRLLQTLVNETFLVDMHEILLFCSFCKLPCCKQKFAFCQCKDCLPVNGMKLRKVGCWNCKFMFQKLCPRGNLGTFNCTTLSEFYNLEFKIKASQEYHFGPFMEQDFKCKGCSDTFNYSRIFIDDSTGSIECNSLEAVPSED